MTDGKLMDFQQNWCTLYIHKIKFHDFLLVTKTVFQHLWRPFREGSAPHVLLPLHLLDILHKSLGVLFVPPPKSLGREFCGNYVTTTLSHAQSFIRWNNSNRIIFMVLSSKDQ